MEEKEFTYSARVYEIEKKIALIEQDIKFAEKFDTAYKEHFKDLENQYRKLMKEAFDLQAGEYSRRLLELNHAHKIAEDNWSMSLPRETFELWKGEYEKKQIDIGLLGTTYLTIATFNTWKKEHDNWKLSVAPVADMKLVQNSVDKIESKFDQLSGAIRLALILGATGFVGLVIAILRMAGLVK